MPRARAGGVRPARADRPVLSALPHATAQRARQVWARRLAPATRAGADAAQVARPGQIARRARAVARRARAVARLARAAVWRAAVQRAAVQRGARMAHPADPALAAVQPAGQQDRSGPVARAAPARKPGQAAIRARDLLRAPGEPRVRAGKSLRAAAPICATPRLAVPDLRRPSGDRPARSRDLPAGQVWPALACRLAVAADLDQLVRAAGPSARAPGHAAAPGRARRNPSQPGPGTHRGPAGSGAAVGTPREPDIQGRPDPAGARQAPGDRRGRDAVRLARGGRSDPLAVDHGSGRSCAAAAPYRGAAAPAGRCRADRRAGGSARRCRRSRTASRRNRLPGHLADPGRRDRVRGRAASPPRALRRLPALRAARRADAPVAWHQARRHDG